MTLLEKKYKNQFEFIKLLKGKKIEQIFYFLEEEDLNSFSEQKNEYGHSLLNGIEIIIDGITYFIGNGFDDQYGLEIKLGKIENHEWVESTKNRVSVNLNCIGKRIEDIYIYWKRNPWQGKIGFYPQEIEIKTKKRSSFFSSIEINNGKANVEFTDELLIVEKKLQSKELQLGGLGIKTRNLHLFKNHDEMS